MALIYLKFIQLARDGQQAKRKRPENYFQPFCLLSWESSCKEQFVSQDQFLKPTLCTVCTRINVSLLLHFCWLAVLDAIFHALEISTAAARGNLATTVVLLSKCFMRSMEFDKNLSQ